MKIITSMENPIIMRAASLKTKKYRDKEAAYLIEGYHICMEAFDVGGEIEYIIFSEETRGRNLDLLNKAKSNKVKTIQVPQHVLKKISDVKTPTGLVAIMKKQEVDEEIFFKSRGNYLVLDRIRDPGNVGTLIRTSEATGFKGVIVIKGSADVYSPKVVRSAAGSILRQPLFFVEDAQSLLELLKKHGITLAVTSPNAQAPFTECRQKEKLALVIGNESEGVDEILIKKADWLLEIPMAGKVESLNAAVAGGILMCHLGTIV